MKYPPWVLYVSPMRKHSTLATAAIAQLGYVGHWSCTIVAKASTIAKAESMPRLEG